MTHDRRPYFDTEPDVEPETPTHAEPPSPQGECCMCGARDVALFWAQFCEVRLPGGGWRYGAGYRCSDVRACRERRLATLETNDAMGEG